jgi:hypothetical protein
MNGTSIGLTVKLDCARVVANHGCDPDADGVGEVRQSRVYQLVRQKVPIKDANLNNLNIEFHDPDIEFFSLTV